MIIEMVVWLAVRALQHEMAVMTVIFATCLGHELVSRDALCKRLPLRQAVWQAVRRTGAAAALAIVASRLIVGAAYSLLAGQGLDWLIVFAACMAAGSLWHRLPAWQKPQDRRLWRGWSGDPCSPGRGSFWPRGEAAPVHGPTVPVTA